MNDKSLPPTYSPVQEDGLTPLQKAQQRKFLQARGITPGKPFQLSLWGDDKRMQPNDTVRSALFTARQTKVPREFIKRQQVFSPDPTIKIVYTGEELRAGSDEIIWMQLLQYARDLPIGEMRTFNINQLCVDIGWATKAANDAYYEIVYESIERLASGMIKVVSERHGKAAYMPMIVLHRSDEQINKNPTKFMYSIHPDLILLVAGKTVTHLEWAPMKTLNPTQQRLYGYIASHRDPLPLKVVDFHKMCSSLNQNMSSFRQEIKKALDKFVKEGLIIRGWIADGEIHFERPNRKQ